MALLLGAWQQLLQTSLWECLAVVLALAYLVLATRRNIWCWLCALLSTAIYTVLMLSTGLVMDMLLQVYYLFMAGYGYLQWRSGTQQDGELLISSWGWRQHLLAITGVALATVINVWVLQYVDFARSPWLDSFVTWGSVLTTWMVARRILDNWLYWIVVDSVAAYLYFSRGLALTALLFVVYVGMVIYGYGVWRREQQWQSRSIVASVTRADS
jgi:nicotinamide mononucleotide transporter